MYFVRAENAEKVEEYEQKIADILSGKVDTIFMMKEEVEAEYSDRMSGQSPFYVCISGTRVFHNRLSTVTFQTNNFFHYRSD